MSPASYSHQKTNGWPRIRGIVIKGQKLWQVDGRRTVKGRIVGKRRHFSKQEDALFHRADLLQDFRVQGLGALGDLPGTMTAQESSEALQALALLRPINCTLYQAAQIAKDYLERRPKPRKTPTVAEAWEKYLEQKTEEHGRGEFAKRSLTSLASTGRRLILHAWGKRHVEAVTTPEVQKWINSIPGSPHTRRDAKVVFGQLMNFCRSQGWRESNPAEPITIKVKFKEPEALTPEEAGRLLRACRDSKHHATAVPYFSAGCLAGLRPGEAEQLAWEDINLQTRQIKVRGETSKTGKSRYVDLEPEAVALLRPYGKQTGPIIGPSLFLWTKLWQDVRAVAGWRFVGRKLNVKGKEWPDDVLRHTYATYWLARHNDRQRLVELMGNSAKVVATHYRRAVPKAETTAFWKAVGMTK